MLWPPHPVPLFPVSPPKESAHRFRGGGAGDADVIWKIRETAGQGGKAMPSAAGRGVEGGPSLPSFKPGEITSTPHPASTAHLPVLCLHNNMCVLTCVYLILLENKKNSPPKHCLTQTCLEIKCVYKAFRFYLINGPHSADLMGLLQLIPGHRGVGGEAGIGVLLHVQGGPLPMGVPRPLATFPLWLKSFQFPYFRSLDSSPHPFRYPPNNSWKFVSKRKLRFSAF